MTESLKKVLSTLKKAYPEAIFKLMFHHESQKEFLMDSDKAKEEQLLAFENYVRGILTGVRLTALSGSSQFSIQMKRSNSGLQSWNTILNCHLREYPACCGSAMITNFHLLSSVVDDGKMDKSLIPDLLYNYMEVVKYIVINVSGYSDATFILSKDNVYFYKFFVEKKPFIKQTVFTNKRNSHLCDRYLITDIY